MTKAHGAVPCADLTAREIAAIRDALRNKGTPGAARNMLQGLRAAFGWACHEERRLLDDNPTIGVRTRQSIGDVRLLGGKRVKNN